MGDDIEAEVREMLDGEGEIRSRHTLHDNPELVAAIKYFLKLKAAGDKQAQHMTLAWFYREKLRARFNGPSFDAVRNYVRDVLKMDIAGAPL